MEALAARLAANQSVSTTRTYVATTATVCRASWQRFADWIPKVMPILMDLFEKAAEDDELRESCLAALEAFTLRCPKEMTAWVGRISQLCGTFITHDPNYHYDEEEELDASMDVENDGEDEEEGEGEEYSDDEDVSWKVSIL